MEREKQIQEAVARMKTLQIDKGVIRQFQSGQLNLSEGGGFLYWLNEKEKAMVSDFEAKYGTVVYHVVKDLFEFGLCYSLLYVSKEEEEWEADRSDLSETGTSYPIAYVFNETEPDFSEFGSIGVRPSIGGLKRVE